MKKAIIRFSFVVLMAVLVYFTGSVYAEVLYEQNYDDLTTLGTEPGFQPLSELEKVPTALAIDEYSRNSYYRQDFLPVPGSVTIRFFIATTVELTPDSPGGNVYLEGVQGSSYISAANIQWGNVAAGLAAYQDIGGWAQIGDTNFDGEENNGEEWPPALPVSDPENPDEGQWIPVQLVVDIDQAVFDYWQGEPNDMTFSTLKKYGEELYTIDFPPDINRFYFQNTQSGNIFLDNLEIREDDNIVFENDFEGIPEREDDVIAVEEKSMVLLKDIDDGIAEIPDISETFTVRFLLAVESQGGVKNQRAAQLQAIASGTGIGPGGIASFVNWGEVGPGLAAYFDGTAWRAIGDENLNGEQDSDETWPPALQTTNPNEPNAQNWYPIQIVYHYDPEGGVFKTLDYYQGEPNDLEFTTLEQYGSDIIFWNFAPFIDEFEFQNEERGGGTVFIDNFILTTESDSYAFEEDFEGDWERVQPPHSGGVLDSEIAIGSQSIRLRNGTDDLTISFPAASENLIVDFMLAMTAEGGNDERGSQISLSNEEVGGYDGWAPFVCWGQVQPQLANYYDGSQWNIIGDVNKNTAEDGGETWVPETPMTHPDAGLQNWIPVRFEIDITNHSYNFYLGDPGDDSFGNLIQYGSELEFWHAMDQLNLLTFMTSNGRVGGDFFVDNVKIYTPEETPVQEWYLY